MLELPLEQHPRRKRWTVRECEIIGRLGLLPERYELIDGEIYETMPPNPPHILTLLLLADWLQLVFGRLFVRQQVPISLPGVESRPEPDAAVTVERATAYADRLPSPKDLLLVAEVSDTTLNHDLTTKARLYAQAGISEYWVLDIEGRRLVMHRLPDPAGYREVRVYTELEAVALLARPEASVQVSALLPPASGD